MTDTNNKLWQAKLHARLHDPAEKALVLLRDPAGHEGGTSYALHKRLFPSWLPKNVTDSVKQADWWASAADRPQFPREHKDGPYARWTQVDFAKEPVLIHPLSGQQLKLKQNDLGLADVDYRQVKDQSLKHFKRLIDSIGNDDDHKKLALALWRFGPELPRELDDAKLGELWRMLPADTRVPDHSIWDHLDLTAAFAGAFAADEQGECALLSVSLGPVQDFIAQARTASDLWAGSHLLSRLAWQAMQVVADAYGPDAILFPRLRGVALVDVWLQEEIGLPAELFDEQPWKAHVTTDANPLFAAALPNRFLAVVPAAQAAALAKKITATVQAWAEQQAHVAFDKIIDAAGTGRSAAVGHGQINEQLAGFPEVHWSIAPYNSLIATDGDNYPKVADTSALRDCLAPFFTNTDQPGFLGSPLWDLLSKDIEVDGVKFYAPNPGVLYPAVHELADRAQAAAKTARPFEAMPQDGYRCSLTGTAEWLTDDREQLAQPPGKRDHTLWTEVAAKKPSWARKGEHLGALATLKRVWPTLFIDEITPALGADDSRPNRFVVSTHAMALASTLATTGGKLANVSDDLRTEIGTHERAALPRKLLLEHLTGHADGDLIARIPAWIDAITDQNNDYYRDDAQARIKAVLGDGIEAYYGLVLMDGDQMGSWLAGDADKAITYKASFHPQIVNALASRFDRANRNEALQAYLESSRALSPNRHLAISGALGDFSSAIARQVVEQDHMGRLLYAGGDDLMAMVTVSDLLPMMAALRGAYAGHPVESQGGDVDKRYASGYYHSTREHNNNRLYMTMGDQATASMGAIIAHHQAPLGHVLQALHAAEQRAKTDGGRNAFSIQIIKRSGGDVTLTLPWRAKDAHEDHPSHIQTLQALSRGLAQEGTSRRAAYNAYTWLRELPEAAAVGGKVAYRELIQSLLHQQFERQKLEGKADFSHSQPLAALARGDSAATDAELLENVLSVAEFLARESRSTS